VHELRAGTATQAQALAKLRQLVQGMEPDILSSALAQGDISDLPLTTQNYLAGVAEQLSAAAGVDAPDWAAGVRPLERPHFRWPLRSLRPYQLRSGPVDLKRRNVFDPTVGAGSTTAVSAVSHAPPRVEQLSQHLALLELEVEFYFFDDRVLWQEFPRKPASARPSALLRLPPDRTDAVRRYAREQSWPETWPAEALGASLRGEDGVGRTFETAGLRAFAPPPGYALAMKLAARPEGDDGAADDLRFLLRTLNLGGTDAALAVVGHYMAERQLPADTRATLTGLLGR